MHYYIKGCFTILPVSYMKWIWYLICTFVHVYWKLKIDYSLFIEEQVIAVEVVLLILHMEAVAITGAVAVDLASGQVSMCIVYTMELVHHWYQWIYRRVLYTEEIFNCTICQYYTVCAYYVTLLGAATGGTLGYLFGSRGGRSYGGSGWGSSGGGWGSSGGGWSSGSSSSSSSSSSRTSSGFGGTSRR